MPAKSKRPWEALAPPPVNFFDGDGGSDLIKVFDIGLPDGFPGRFSVHEDWGCGFTLLGFVVFVAVVLVLKHFLFG
jgi:hypothetical protein